MKTTIRDVAKMSGVSVGTVSHVINHRLDLVSEDKRQRVLAAIRELNYRPRAASADRVAPQVKTLGVVIQHTGRMLIHEHPWLNTVLSGVLAEASLRSCSVLVTVDPDREAMLRDIRHRIDGKCEGLILLGHAVSRESAEMLWERGVPFVQVGVSVVHDDSVLVDVDNVAGTRRAVDHLVQLGHRRIGFLGNEPTSYCADRFAGYADALHWAGVVPSNRWHFPGYVGEEPGTAAADAWAQIPLEDRPTAMVCLSDTPAIAFIQRVQELGFRVPQDVSVFGFDDIPMAVKVSPGLSTVRQPMVELGRTAVLEVLRLFEGQRHAQRTLFQPELIIRGSVAVPGGSPQPQPTEATNS